MPALTRRRLLTGAAAGGGLLVAWAIWPRDVRVTPHMTKDGAVLDSFVRIGRDGMVTVGVPQAELGQGVTTTLPQLVADQLGADWRRVAVELAAPAPAAANTLFARELWADSAWPGWALDAWAGRTSFAATAGMTIASYGDRMRASGATARALLCMAAAERWGVDWRECDTDAHEVAYQEKRLPFAALAAKAARLTPPDPPPLRPPRVAGHSLPRLDLPTHVDGTLTYAADIRLPDLCFAALLYGPPASSVAADNRAAAEQTPGFLDLISTGRFVAAIGTTSWAARQALAAARPRFKVAQPITQAQLRQRLAQALPAAEPITQIGQPNEQLEQGRVLAATYDIKMGLQPPLEPSCVVARLERGALELWLPTQAPAAVARAAAKAVDLPESAVTVHSLFAGGSFGARWEPELAAAAAFLAQRLKRPVQVQVSRRVERNHLPLRPPALVRCDAKLAPAGAVSAWRSRVAMPAWHREWRARVFESGEHVDRKPDALSLPDPLPPYAVPHAEVAYAPVEIGLPSGNWRGGAQLATCFAHECFVDELAAQAGSDPFSFRIGLLANNSRLANCLNQVATLGNWQGGQAGSEQGVALLQAYGSCIAVLVEASLAGGAGVSVRRISAAVDCGQVVNPQVVQQQIVGGLLYGLAIALAEPLSLQGGQVEPGGLHAAGYRSLGATPAIRIALVPSRLPAGGVSELAVPPVGPAIANALHAATGTRYRSLPIAT